MTAGGPRRWCPDCGTRRRVEDTFSDSYYEPWGEQGVTVTAFDCGHTTHTKGVTIGPAPGAPYAGPRMPDPFLSGDSAD